MSFRFNISLLSVFICLLISYTPVWSSPVDGTSFMKSLIADEIRKSEKKCKKTMRKTASCKINIQKVLISKEAEDTANIEVISDVKITAKLFIKASANAKIHAKATYQIRTCEFKVLDVSKEITKLTGAALYLEPFKDSIKKIDVPTGLQQIKDTETRNKADNYLEKQLKLVSSKEAQSCGSE